MKHFNREELESSFSGYPPILSVDQAAALLQIPTKTIYEWSSQGRLSACARKRGKRLLILRDRFIEELFHGQEW
ncbi:MAG: helix-turn-helix domain-containing protein [Planctomycetota bacterium]